MALGQSSTESIPHDIDRLRAVPPRKPVPVYEAVPQESESTVAKLPWRPFYLRRRILGAFIAVLVAFLFATEALFVVSERNQGLATSQPSLHYLWTYGPTAALTLVAAVWARVHFQAQLAAPWLRMWRGPADAHRTLLLDYTAMLPPVALVKAMRYRDFLVAATTMTAFMFAILIILSTSLITLSPTKVIKSEVPLMLQSVFIDSPPKGSDLTDNLIYDIIRGLVNGNLTNPDGTSENFAYQTIATNSTPTAEIRTTVDGLSGGLDCEPASLGPVPMLYFSYGRTPSINMSFITPRCTINLTVDQAPGNGSSYMGQFKAGSCGGSAEKADQRIALFFGLFTVGAKLDKTVPDEYSENGPAFYNATVQNSTQLICKPTYDINSVDLVKNGSVTQRVTLSKDSSPTKLSNVDPWDIATAHFETFFNVSPDMQLINISGEAIHADVHTVLAINNHETRPENVTLLFQNDKLESYMDWYYRQCIVTISHHLLMSQASIPSTGTATTIENRLVVQELAAHLMTALLGVTTLLVVAAWVIIPRKGFLPRDASTLLGQAALLSHSSDMLRMLRDLSGAEQTAVTKAITGWNYCTGLTTSESTRASDFTVLGSQFSPHQPSDSPSDPDPTPVQARFTQPWVLRPVSKVILVLIAGAIATLEALLHVSDKNSGLGNVGDDKYLHYLWTVVPTAIMSLLSLHLASVDVAIRSLVPYAFLTKGAPLNWSLNLNLLDRSIPRALFEELRVGAYAGFAMTMTLPMAWFLPIITSSLFLDVSIPQIFSTQLVGETTFVIEDGYGYAPGELDGEAIASLVLQSNLSYPPFTYEDLAVLSVSLPPTFVVSNETGRSQASSLVFNTTVPALRSKLSCKVYNSSQITAKFLNSVDDSGEEVEYIEFAVNGEICDAYSDGRSPKPGVLEVEYYGLATGRKMSSVCSDWLYVWGHSNMHSNPNNTIGAAMGCNETIEVVDVAATFSGVEFAIDAINPPVPLESTARTRSPVIENLAILYQEDLAIANTKGNVFDPFFAMLTTSPHAIPPETLGDPARVNDVAAAIQFQHRIMRSMNLGLDYRASADESNATEGASQQADSTDTGSYNATVQDPLGRRRVIQDAASTRVLEALLGAILVLSIASWAMMPQTALLPRLPGSIAGDVALLAGGNLFEYLPSGAEWWSDAELEEHFRALGIDLFCMGSNTLEGGLASDGHARFTIYAPKSERQIANRSEGGSDGDGNDG